MKTENVKQVIQELFRQNFNAYPESYPLTTGFVNNTTPNEKGELLATDEAVMNVQECAIGYFANRNEDEVERDESLGITEINYVEWCMEEFSKLIPEAK